MKHIIIVLTFLSIIIKILSRATSFLKQAPKKSTLYLGVDDIVASIKINGNELLKKEGKSGWSKTHTYKIGLLPGDFISITGKNWGNQRNDDRNPACIIATLLYVNPDGETVVYNTNDKNWKCDGQKPLNLGCTSGCPWKLMARKGAKAIWGKSRTGTTTCTFTIPCDD